MDVRLGFSPAPWVLLSLSLLPLGGCELLLVPTDRIVLTDSSEALAIPDSPNRIEPNPPIDSKTICDPFSNTSDSTAGASLGIVGRMAYLTDAMPRYGSARSYLEHGVPVDATLFVDKLDVPTRRFDLGFQTQNGTLIKNQNGNTLYEYFGLKLESELQLSGGNAPGRYQLALLSDDGAVLEVNDRGDWETLIDNDGVHPTRMGCALRTVQVTEDGRIPIRVHYYQGPRYHIALQLLWRKIDDNAPSSALNDALCGAAGNNLFFDYSRVPSTPKAAFNDLLSRGWRVLEAQNYALPRAVQENPCHSNDPIKTFLTKFTPEGDVTRLADVEFEFTSNREDATFECSLDGSAYEACSSPKRYEALEDGNHEFKVRALLGDEVDLEGATYVWRIDRFPPLLTFVSVSNTTSTVGVQWTTSEPSTAEVRWGVTPDAENLIPETSTYVTSHSALFEGITPATTVYFYLGGRDQAGNAFSSSRFATSTRR